MEKDYLQVIYGDTDSLYISYEGLLDSIEGSENWTVEEKIKFIVKLHDKFINQHNEDFMKDYYDKRFAKSIHQFELETVATSAVFLDVKKRYAQILGWKDGKLFDIDDKPLKVKGLEIIKSSYPAQSRKALKRLVRYLLEENDPTYFIQKLNIKVQEEKIEWMKANLEDICENKSVSNYTKYIISDENSNGLEVAPKCPYNCRALGTYNWLRNTNNLSGDPIYGGKLKIYQVLTNSNTEMYFAFQSRNYPKWASSYAPIDREKMFIKYLLEPFNRILTAIGLAPLSSNGAIQLSLF